MLLKVHHQGDLRVSVTAATTAQDMVINHHFFSDKSSPPNPSNCSQKDSQPQLLITSLQNSLNPVQPVTLRTVSNRVIAPSTGREQHPIQSCNIVDPVSNTNCNKKHHRKIHGRNNNFCNLVR